MEEGIRRRGEREYEIRLKENQEFFKNGVNEEES